MSSCKPASLGLTPSPFCLKSQGQRKFQMAHVHLWGLLSPPKYLSGCMAFATELVLPTATHMCVCAFGELDSEMAAPPSSQSGSPAPHGHAPFTKAQSPREKQCFHRGRWLLVTTGSLSALSRVLNSEHSPFSFQRVFLSCLYKIPCPACPRGSQAAW